MNKLLFIPHAFPEESPTSILKRMAIRHGCRLPSDLQSIFGRAFFNGALISRSHPIIQDIATRAEVAGEEFSSSFYEPIGTLSSAPPLKIAGLVVSAAIIRKHGAAFCSECWSSGHEHYIKDLKLARYCPYHFKKYLTQCPHCHINLRWYNPLTGSCRCKHELVSPPCLPNEATSEQKLLTIFRTGATEKFEQLVKSLKQLNYPLELDTPCPTNRCLLSMAFAFLEDDMTTVFSELRMLHAFYPDVPKRIICARIATISHPKVRECMQAFLRHNVQDLPQEKKLPLQPLYPFTVSKAQMGAWLRLTQHQWKAVTTSCNLKSHRAQYSWNQAQTIAEHVLRIKLCNGFKKKKLALLGVTTKELQHKLRLSTAVIKNAAKERLLTPFKGWDRKVRFAPDDVEQFSKKFISIRLLSAQYQITTSLIRKALNRFKVPQIEFENKTLRCQLIRTETAHSIIERVSSTSQNRCKAPSIRLSPRLSRYTPNATETWVPTHKAAEFLGICKSAARHLVKAGLFDDARRKYRGGYLINQLALNKFKKKYVSPTEAGILMGCNRPATTKTLTHLDISPVTGPEIDGNPSRFYLRKNILTYAKTAKQLQHERSMGYTTEEAVKQLHISASAVSNLVNTGLLKLVGPRLQSQRLIRKRSIDKFFENYAKSSTVAEWLKIPQSHGCLYNTLKRLGISPISGPPLDASTARIYAIKDIEKVFSTPIHSKSHSSRCEHKSPLVDVSELRHKYDISGRSFGQLFLTSGFVDPIRVGTTTYLTRKDVSKIEGILENHYTCAQASRKLGLTVYNLLKNNKLESAYPLKGYWDHPMIEKIKLQDYTIKRHHA
jgi:hypothetical protein